MENRRVLVTGVTGFVGRRLAAALARQGAHVVGLSRDAVAARKRVPSLADAYDWRTDAEPAPARALAGVDAVIHLAGEPVVGRWTGPKQRRIRESRVRGTAFLVDAIAARKNGRPAVLVSASGIGIYGEPPPGTRIDEDHPSGDDFLANVCVDWEREARRASEFGVRTVQLRIGVVLGPEDGALKAMLPMFKLGLGGRVGSGEQVWSWIHVDDLVSMILAAIRDETWTGAVNAVAPNPVKQIELARTLGGVLGRPVVMRTPAFAVRAALGAVSHELLADRYVVPARALERGFAFAHPTLEPALRELLR